MAPVGAFLLLVMTIEDHSKNYAQTFQNDRDKDIAYSVFYQGAKFQQSEDIEKACEWLTKHAEDYTEPQSDWIHVDKLVKDFRKFMKGE